MEHGLLQLLNDFHCGKLQAFGNPATFNKMDAIRVQQEQLARQHFEMDLLIPRTANRLSSEESRKENTEKMDKLVQQLHSLSTSVYPLQVAVNFCKFRFCSPGGSSGSSGRAVGYQVRELKVLYLGLESVQLHPDFGVHDCKAWRIKWQLKMKSVQYKGGVTQRFSLHRTAGLGRRLFSGQQFTEGLMNSGPVRATLTVTTPSPILNNPVIKLHVCIAKDKVRLLLRGLDIQCTSNMI
ncbi:coiled-coil domain-containing protein 28b [Plakobranchus ocellatus]|uniref:Coiled-coil domain-containing protein 28b n=1 Tax=Plakobranchus ocellatus TaxID=259542 RepID=A0AAV4ABC9_9GAST|nr:coiled-coil domain-containing protein 28b [Plakobranchus ocellatus]